MKIGIDLGGSHIGVGVIDNKNFIVEKVEKRLLAKDKKDVKNIIESYIIKNVKEFSSKYKIIEIGIAVPGTIKKEQILKSVNLGVREYKLVENLKKEIQLPIKIRNDAKCAALAENTIGALKDYKRSLFLTLGTGIGGAAFLDGKLLEAGTRSGYEFGHMIIEKNGIECVCGRKGCFERYASMKSFKNKLRNALGLDETTRGEELLKMIRDNNEENKNYEIIENSVSEYIEDLSIGISNLINIFEPEVIGIGGSFVHFEDVFLGRLRDKINKENEKIIGRENVLIKTAVLGNDAGIIGAVCDK